MFTLKVNKEPTTPLKVPQKPWQDLRVYLFGPIPEKKHILVFQGQTNMFSNCKNNTINCCTNSHHCKPYSNENCLF